MKTVSAIGGGVRGLVVLAVLMCAGWVGAGIIYVDASAAGGGDGASWETGYNCLQDALDDAVRRAKPVEVWVAKGLYTPTREVGGSGEKYKAFQMINGVGIYGGFQGWEPCTFDLRERDLVAYESVLSADVSGNDKPHPDAADLWNDPNRGDNCRHVFNHPEGSALDATAILDGFIISGGHSHNIGAGMYNFESSPTLRNCIFKFNVAEWGGALANSQNSSPTVINCTFTCNAGYGSGMLNSYGSNPTVSNCSFVSNWSEGMYNYYDSKPRVTNCIFSGNAGERYSRGMINRVRSNPIISNCILWGNGSARENQMYADETSGPLVSYCDVGGSGGSSSWDVTLGIDGGGNIDADPCFVEAGRWDPNRTPGDARDDFLVEGDYRLRIDSPCIDAGEPGYVWDGTEVDLGGGPRVVNGRIDMGAYEFSMLEAEVRVAPQVLVRKAKGPKEVLAVVYLGEQCEGWQFDAGEGLTLYPGGAGSVRCSVVERPGGRYKGVSIAAGFARDDVLAAIAENGETEVEIVGHLNTGEWFSGTDVVRVK